MEYWWSLIASFQKSAKRLNMAVAFLTVRFFKKIQDWMLKPEGIPKQILRFFILNRSIRDLWYQQKNRRIRLQSSFDAPWFERSWINLFSKETQNPFSDAFGFNNPILNFLKKRTLNSVFGRTAIPWWVSSPESTVPLSRWGLGKRRKSPTDKVLKQRLTKE